MQQQNYNQFVLLFWSCINRFHGVLNNYRLASYAQIYRNISWCLFEKKSIL